MQVSVYHAKNPAATTPHQRVPWWGEVSPYAQQQRGILSGVRRRERTAGRDEMIVRMAADGLPRSAIAARFGLTVQRIGQILKRESEPLSEGEFTSKDKELKPSPSGSLSVASGSPCLCCISQSRRAFLARCRGQRRMKRLRPPFRPPPRLNAPARRITGQRVYTAEERRALAVGVTVCIECGDVAVVWGTCRHGLSAWRCYVCGSKGGAASACPACDADESEPAAASVSAHTKEPSLAAL